MKAPTIVAEVGASHCGQLALAKTCIAAAKSANADAVKLQTWSPGTMTVSAGKLAPVGDWTVPLDKLYEQALLPWEDQAAAFAYGRSIGIEVFASVFDEAALYFLEAIDCPRYKIASFEITDLELITLVAKTGKPMILSTGAATIREVGAAVIAARAGGATDITLLHCVSEYPAALEQMNLVMMKELGRFTDKVGLSDHSKTIIPAMAAAALGASMIEKHIKTGVQPGLDDKFALDQHEFDQMASMARMTATAMGERHDRVPRAAALKRSLWFVEDVEPGQAILRRHIATARPADGLDPAMIHHVIGRPATRAIKAGEPVTTGAFG